MTTPVGRRAERLLDRHARTRRGLARRLARLLGRMWDRLDPYDGEQVAAFARQASQAVTTAQGLSATATEVYLRAVLRELDAPLPRARLVELPDTIRPVDLDEVYQRPARQVRYLESTGVDGDKARTRGRARLVVTADDDLNLAEREASRQVLTAAGPRVTGWRRVLRPELSQSGPCGLCVAASDRTYSVSELLPIHGRCKCVPMPITADHDPGASINAADLRRIYAAAGGTDAARLKRVRVQVHEHGELGPVLRVAGDDFRGPRKAAKAVEPPDTKAQARAEITALERTYAGLLERQTAGEDVSGPLEWQRARLEVLRSRLTA
jgi:hypothetical protein